jgi:hypothetical protein
LKPPKAKSIVRTQSMKQETYHRITILIQTFSLICILTFSGLQYSINNRLKDIEQDTQLRPVILRSSNISWEDLQPLPERPDKKIFPYKKDEFLEFIVVKNIGAEIEGKIILNGYSYTLHFFNDLSQIQKDRIACEEKWGWVQEGSKLYAFFTDHDKEKSTKENQIILNYKDINGNDYSTIENKNYSSKVCRIKDLTH